MKRSLMTFVIAALYLWSSAFTVNAPQSLTQSALNEYNVAHDNSIKTVGIIKNLSDEDLLEAVQRQTFRYFWHYAHPNSGMTRERSNTVKADFYLDFINEADDEPNLSRGTFGPEACAVGVPLWRWKESGLVVKQRWSV